MLPTAVFKCRTLIFFAILGELFSLVFPNHVNVSLKAVIEKAKFTEFYCACGTSHDTERELIKHLRSYHPFIQKLFNFLSKCFLPLSCLNMTELMASDLRSGDVLGTIKE